MEVSKIGVLGAGLMGAGIVQVAAASGYNVTLVDVTDELVARGVGPVGLTAGELIDSARKLLNCAMREPAGGR